MIGLTGASGILGRALRASWPECEVSEFCGDISNSQTVVEWVQQTPAEIFIHFAAIVPVRKVEEFPLRAFEVNVNGTLNLCDALRRYRKEAWLFLASSSHVYAPSAGPIDEDGVTRPISLYGFTKLEAERAAQTWSERFGMPLCVGRIFSFSAPSQPSEYLLPSLVNRIRAAERDATLSIVGGRQTRDFLSAVQIVSIVKRMATQRAGGVYNIASGVGTQILDVATMLASRLGRNDLTIRTDDDSTQALVADTSKLKKLGIEPRNDLSDLLDELASA